MWVAARARASEAERRWDFLVPQLSGAQERASSESVGRKLPPSAPQFSDELAHSGYQKICEWEEERDL